MINTILLTLYNVYKEDPHQWVDADELIAHLKENYEVHNLDVDLHYLEQKRYIETSIRKYRLTSPAGVEQARILDGVDIDYEKENFELQKQNNSISFANVAVAIIAIVVTFGGIKSCSVADVEQSSYVQPQNLTNSNFTENEYVASDLCSYNETVVISCEIGEKILSICGINNGYDKYDNLTYRFGFINSIELEYPKNPVSLNTGFRLDTYIDSSNHVDVVKFVNTGYQYLIYSVASADILENRAGVIVIPKKGKTSNLSCNNNEFKPLLNSSFSLTTNVVSARYPNTTFEHITLTH